MSVCSPMRRPTSAWCSTTPTRPNRRWRRCELSSFHEDGQARSVRAPLGPCEASQRLRRAVNKAGDDPGSARGQRDERQFHLEAAHLGHADIGYSWRERPGLQGLDVAFLHDVVSRAAQSEWLSAPWTNDRPNLEHALAMVLPQRFGRKRAQIHDVSGLPLADSLRLGLRVRRGRRLPPARRVAWRALFARPAHFVASSALAGMIKDAHDLAEWVATYDELLDKRQLQHNDITVVRYRRGSTNGRNMIVSSTSELRLLVCWCAAGWMS